MLDRFLLKTDSSRALDEETDDERKGEKAGVILLLSLTIGAH